MTPPAWPLPVPPSELRQPDERTCGATALVVARMVLDPGYAAWVAAAEDRPARLRAESLRAHQACTGVRDDRRRPQVPWPPALGTPPWGLARQLGRLGRGLDPPVTYRTVLCRWSRGVVFGRLLAARHPVPLYVGTPWVPRHVVLVVGAHDGRLVCHEPTAGRVLVVDRATFVAGGLPVGRFGHPWCAVLPVA